MPTDVASPAAPGLGIANTRVLRLAFGTALSLWISQAVGWSISYIAPVITMFLLAMPIARPKAKFFVVVVLAIVVSVYGSFLFLPLLLYQKAVGFLLLALALFHGFYFSAKGGAAVVSTLITIGLAMTVAVGSVSVDALLAIAAGLTIGTIVGAFVAFLSHVIIPDPPLDNTAAAQGDTPATIPLAIARRNAMRALTIVLPITLWFLVSVASASNMAVMIKVAAMGQEAANQHRCHGRLERFAYLAVTDFVYPADCFCGIDFRAAYLCRPRITAEWSDLVLRFPDHDRSPCARRTGRRLR
jgi:hypothetical protein